MPVEFLLSEKTSGGTQVQHNLAVANCLVHSEPLMEGDHPRNTFDFETAALEAADAEAEPAAATRNCAPLFLTQRRKDAKKRKNRRQGRLHFASSRLCVVFSLADAEDSRHQQQQIFTR